MGPLLAHRAVLIHCPSRLFWWVTVGIKLGFVSLYEQVCYHTGSYGEFKWQLKTFLFGISLTTVRCDCA